MSEEQVKVGYVMSASVKEKLRLLAERYRRSMSSQIAWLVEQEWDRLEVEEGSDGDDGES